MTLAKDCAGDDKVVPLATVAGSRTDWTEERGMDSLAGDVGGSMVTKYYNSLEGEIEGRRYWIILDALLYRATRRNGVAETIYEVTGSKQYHHMHIVRVPHRAHSHEFSTCTPHSDNLALHLCIHQDHPDC